MDLNELKEMVSMTEVLDRYGISYKKKGKYYFLRCLSPEHEDKHPSSFFTNKNIHCPSCGCNYSVLDVIMQFENCNIKDAIKILWEMAGRPDDFIISKNENAENTNKKYYPPKKLLNILDLTLPKKVFMPYGETIENKVVNYTMGDFVDIDEDGNFHYLYGKEEKMEYSEYEIKDMLHGKINEKINEIVRKRNIFGIKSLDETTVELLYYLMTEKDKLERERY